jgi:hypothetical protein
LQYRPDLSFCVRSDWPKGKVIGMDTERKRLIFVFKAAIFTLLAIVCLCGSSLIRAGSGSLITLSGTNFREFEKAFDHDVEIPRLVLLVSPT